MVTIFKELVNCKKENHFMVWLRPALRNRHVVKLTQNISFLVIKKYREYYNKIFSKKIAAIRSFTIKKIVLQILWLKLQWVSTGKKGLDKC